MKIERLLAKRQTLEQFADEHGLTLRIGERTDPKLPRYWVSFPNLERPEGGVLISDTGNGQTEQEAIRDYTANISEKLMVIDAFLPTRKDVVVPVLEP